MTLRHGVIAQQNRRTIIDRDQNIDGAIVVEIAHRHATRGERPRENGAALLANVEKRLAGISEQKRRLFVFNLLEALFDAIVGMAVGKKQIHVPVIVVVKELDPPAAQEPGSDPNTGLHGHIVEAFVVEIAVNRVHLLVHVGDEEIHPAVVIVIGGIHTHSGARVPVGAVCHARHKSDLFKPAFSAVGEQVIEGGVIGYEQVHPAVIVDVGGHYAPGF